MYYLLTANPFETVSKPIISLLDMALVPAMGIVGALGAIYCIILGAKLAKAEEPQDRETDCSVEAGYGRNAELDEECCWKYILDYWNIELRILPKPKGKRFLQ